MSSANNNASGASGSGRNKGKAREMSADVARRIELEQRAAELAEQMAALQAELAQLKRRDDKNVEEDNGGNNGGHDEEDDGEREEETNAGQKRPAPEEGGEGRKPEIKRRRKHYGPDVPNQWEADPFVPCSACQHRLSECLPIPNKRFASSSCERCRRKKVKCSFVLVTDKSRVNRREKEKSGKPAGKSGQSTPRISGAGLVPDSPIRDYLRGDSLEDLRTRMMAVEIRLGIEPGGRLYRIEESEPPSPMPPPPVPKVERLTLPQLIFEPNEGTAGPAEEGAEQRELIEGAPEEGQLAEAMEVDRSEVRADSPPEEERQEPEIKVEPEERRVPRPKEVIKAKKVLGKFKDQDVEFIEIL
ncbi:hypothetical protein GGX14DRAFT_559257 [Mycena pura]|uniref:Zn(2)-C6 fungal-type domain-containing protein n=1 Tax=Mycena pura TaxID=153505 RepID=A0AAD6YGK4_9AGAR|nr:hypothetical protein GGX14DRAFT_559257 [Mycena pura]